MLDVLALIKDGGIAIAAVVITWNFLNYMRCRDASFGKALSNFTTALKEQANALNELKVAVHEMCEIARKCSKNQP